MPDSRLIFEKYAERYDRWYTEGEGRFLAPIEMKVLKKLIEGENTTEAIEVGVGTGYFSKALSIPWGIDPAGEVLKIAKQRGIKVIQGYGEQLPLKNRTFSLVLMVVTICFVDDPLKTIKESYRILKEGGIILLGIVPRNSKWGQLYLQKKANGHIFYGGAEFYTVKEIEEMLASSGFENITGISTLYQEPSENPQLEDTIKDILDEKAGFVAIKGKKGGKIPPIEITHQNRGKIRRDWGVV